MPVQCICRRCGVAFSVKPYLVAKGFGKYCSRACAKPRVMRACAFCGEQAKVKPYRAHRTTYCSPVCFYAGTGRHREARPGAETPEYKTWSAIKDRCLNPRHHNYRRYGGRGITICDRWRDSYEEFLADVGRRPSSDHSIDRIDNDGNYEPGNVRWATRTEQQTNKGTYTRRARKA